MKEDKKNRIEIWQKNPDLQLYDSSNLKLAGLLAGYFDACIGWAPTQDRYNSFNFTISHSKSKELALFYAKGAEGDLHDLTGKKVGMNSPQTSFFS